MDPRAILPSVTSSFVVRGTTNRSAAISQVEVNDYVCLEPEPDNKVDRLAIMVIVIRDAKLLHIGYVPRELCEFVHELLDGTRPCGIWNTVVADILVGVDDLTDQSDKVYSVTVQFESECSVPRR